MSYRILITCLIFFSINSKLFAQDALKIAEEKDSKRDAETYTIKSLEGKNQKVHVLPDYVNRVLRITCLKDTINIIDFWGVPAEVVVLNKTFIKIKYAVRAGSNLGSGNILLACVSHNKLYEAMHISEYLTSETGAEQSAYNVKMALIGVDKKTFALKIKVHDALYSKISPETNYKYDEQSLLHFDEKRNVFYSIKKDIYDSFVLEGEKSKQQIKGNFPEILLGDINYCYIKNRWWKILANNYLEKY